MTVLVTGVTGQLGCDVVRYLDGIGYDVLSPKRSVLDLSNERSVVEYFDRNSPDVIIHCAAWTNVDQAEVDVESCRRVNVDGTQFIADYCMAADVPVLYVSTDYVFNGTGNRPWETDDETNPVNQYGLSKRDGEDVIRKLRKYYIVRTSWVFGSNGNNFIRTMMNLSSKVDVVRVVDDQFGSPTYTVDLAPLLWQIANSGKYGIYHAHNDGFCSWYDVAVEVFGMLGTRTLAIPINSSEYPSKAKRPSNSRLGTSSLTDGGFNKLPRWEDAVNRYIKEMNRFH